MVTQNDDGKDNKVGTKPQEEEEEEEEEEEGQTLVPSSYDVFAGRTKLILQEWATIRSVLLRHCPACTVSIPSRKRCAFETRTASLLSLSLRNRCRSDS